MSGTSLLGLAAAPSADGGIVTLSVKPHAFEGAVLSPKHARELTPSLCLAIASALSEQSYRKNAIPYTLWITEAWRVLGWAEPSAALFWEMATMYHTLYLAGRSYAADYHESQSHIPPILSCGSTSSLGSGNTPTTFSSHPDRKKYSTTASAKELPVWLVGTFLLLHCEECAYLRNLSGQDERRFYGGAGSTLGGPEPVLQNAAAGGKVDFTSLLKHPALSPRTRIHAGWHHDNSHCIVYALRHLRKLLLLSAVSHNPEAVRACMHLAAIPSSSPPPFLSTARRATAQHSGEELRRKHDEEHGNVGSDVRLTMDDLERLHFWMQPPSGGGVDDPPVKIGEYLWSSLYSTPAPPTASIALAEVERELRRHLELELLMAGHDHDETSEASQTSSQTEEDAAAAMSKLSLIDSRPSSGSDEASSDAKAQTSRAKQPQQGYHKELSYTHLRGTTILLKPNSHYSETGPSSGASASSGDNFGGLAGAGGGGRLHDLAIYDCSDAHMYLLQPFEHVTIAACTGCTIVVGAVAGLLHIVDCEKTTVTSAARRMLVSNSFDVLHCVFTPSPPLLVGDNRNCQFAPYNTYYDGLREDLLATGLAAAVAPENLSPYHGNRSQENDVVLPPLQCASNKWKQPVEIAKLEIPQVQTSGGGGGGTSAGSTSGSGAAPPGADDKAVSGTKSGTGNDDTMHTPVLLPASEFHVLFVPLERDSALQRRLEAEEQQRLPASGESSGGVGGPLESQYCRNLAEVLQLSPFRLPVEYERHALDKADRMRSLQQAIQKSLTEEQQIRLEEELNRGFRDWLVTSGNLRQVLDLVHMERRAGV